MKELNFTYCYYGANCTIVTYKEDSKGIITAKNDYGEIIFKNFSDFFNYFLAQLRSGYFA